MATQILMPALSPTMEEGTLAKWLVKEGDTVSSGDILAEIETDKATMEFEAVDEGTLGKILIEEGTEGVKVNTPIAVLVEEGESADDIDLDDASAEQAAPADKEQSSETGPSDGALPPQSGRPEEVAAGGARGSRGHRDGQADAPRGAARRHGRGDAPRRGSLRHGRGGRRVPGRLQGHPGVARRVRCAPGDRHARSPSTGSRGSASARRSAGCGRSSSS